jgi:FAD binding domain
VILTPLPGRRWGVYLRPTSDTSDLVAEAGEVIGRYAPRATFADVENPTRFRCHSRVAARFRSGRVLLAGDGAHACTPAEGHGESGAAPHRRGRSDGGAGRTPRHDFMELDRRMEELREEFGLDIEDLNLDRGRLGGCCSDRCLRTGGAAASYTLEQAAQECDDSGQEAPIAWPRPQSTPILSVAVPGAEARILPRRRRIRGRPTRKDGACSAIPTRVPAGCDAGLRCWARCPRPDSSPRCLHSRRRPLTPRSFTRRREASSATAGSRCRAGGRA